MEPLEPAGAQEAEVVDAGVVARALVLLDQGLVADARALLAGALRDDGGAPAEPDASFDRFGDAELDEAFADARPETDAMIDADGIAFEAIRRARLDEPESVALPSPDSPFHTRTMADLLERQGDRESADAIRCALGGHAPDDPNPVDDAVRVRTIQTLERWLARLRGGDA